MGGGGAGVCLSNMETFVGVNLVLVSQENSM